MSVLIERRKISHCQYKLLELLIAQHHGILYYFELTDTTALLETDKNFTTSSLFHQFVDYLFLSPRRSEFIENKEAILNYGSIYFIQFYWY